MEVRLPKDGKVVVFHDRKPDRTSTGAGPVGTHTLSEMKSLDVGSWYASQFKGERVLTLEEVFSELPSDFLVYVEVKARGPDALPLAAKTVKVIRKFRRWESTLVASFNPVAMVFVRVVEPRIFRRIYILQQPPAAIKGPLVQPSG